MHARSVKDTSAGTGLETYNPLALTMSTNHSLSDDDRRFRSAFEASSVPAAMFDHRAHVRLAYTYLAKNDADTSLTLMRTSPLAFLRNHGIPISSTTRR